MVETGGLNMKCEVCGGPILSSSYDCEVCGRKMCHHCGGWTGGPGVIRYLCPTHYAQVRDFIDGLKPKDEGPKARIRHEEDWYNFYSPGDLECPGYRVAEDVANALYDHMRRERGHD
jgi:predicted amidophosphoribosyltransferase